MDEEPQIVVQVPRTTLVSYKGQTLTLTGWSAELGGEKHLVSYRLRQGWSLKKAITTPPEKRDIRHNVQDVIEDLEWILPDGATLEGAAMRLKYAKSKSLTSELIRQNRQDLVVRLRRTAL